MTRFESGLHLPRASGTAAWQPLVELHGKNVEQLLDNPIDLRRAEFHPAGKERITETQLLQWRGDLNDWAFDRGFPAPLNEQRRSAWDVDLGMRLREDTANLAEALHPEVWCWIATNLLPHFVVYRWGWPKLAEGETKVEGRAKWSRFGSDLRNGLRLALHRILVHGSDVAGRASEQEFQSIQYRPSFGLDQRVAQLLLRSLVDAFDDPDSNYGKNGGSRSLDCDDVCQELRVINSLQPLCFSTDDRIVNVVAEVIERLPELRKVRESRKLRRVNGSED